MAGLNTTNELRREIQVLAAENEELKQMVKLLRENHDLRSVLGGAAAGASPLSPVHESTRLESLDHSAVGSFHMRPPLTSTPPPCTPPMSPMGPRPMFMGQLALGGSTLDSTPLSPRSPLMVTPPPLSPGAMGIGMIPQAPRAQRMQPFPSPQYGPPPIRALNLRSPPPDLLRIGGPATPDSGMQGAGFISTDSSSHDFSNRSGASSPAVLRGRGYCHECEVPFHPHIPPHVSLADSVLSGRMNMSGSSLEGASQGSSFG